MLICVCAVLLFHTGCQSGNGSASIAPVTEKTVILAFGDSLTSGYGASAQESYPSVLGGILKCKVINGGVPGEVTSEGEVRIQALIKECRPDLVVLCHGGNDLLQKMNRQGTADNIRGMIRLVRERGADVVMLAVPEPGLFLSAPDFYRDIAREAGIPFDGKIMCDILSDPQLKSDGVHPNAKGYAKMADAVADLIKRSQTR